MKKNLMVLSIILAAAILCPFQVFAAAVEVSWVGNSETDLAGYKIYYGIQPGTYTSTINAGKVTTATINNLETGKTYYVAMSAYDTSNNESVKSAEVSISIPDPDTTPPTGSIIINAGAATDRKSVV